MPKTSYHISLKGYLGGWDFNRNDVDKTLAENEGKPVNVLIDSLGGSLATGLSISAAFKNHRGFSTPIIIYCSLKLNVLWLLLADAEAVNLLTYKRVEI